MDSSFTSFMFDHTMGFFMYIKSQYVQCGIQFEAVLFIRCLQYLMGQKMLSQMACVFVTKSFCQQCGTQRPPFPLGKVSTYDSEQEDEILKWLPTRYNELLSSVLHDTCSEIFCLIRAKLKYSTRLVLMLNPNATCSRGLLCFNGL